MSFKKLSFLYLVFILFLFFSSPGQYVIHYEQMRVTQFELNQRLENKLLTYVPTTNKEKFLIASTLNCTRALDSFGLIYKSYADRNLVYGEKLRESQFAEKEIRKGSYGVLFNKINTEMESAFSQTTGKTLKSDIINLKSFTGQNFNSQEFYFKETPNGVVLSVLEHLKTVYLSNVITALFKQKIILPKYEQISLKDASFIQKFKRVLVLGNSFELGVKLEKPGELPKVLINGSNVDVKPNNRALFELAYLPKLPGKYSVEIILGNKRLFTGFEVLKPEFRFVMEKSSFDAFVGERMIISLDTQYFPSRNVRFISNKAEIVRDKEKLFVTPNEMGLFYITMLSGEEKIDQITLYAHEPENIEVGLLDVSGEPSTLNTANRLESLNTFWQVVSFRMTVIGINGDKQTMRSATRYLRNDLREAEQNAKAGSVLIFDDIKLIGKTRGLIKAGKPLVLKK